MLSRLATRRAGCAKKPARRRWNLDVAHVPFSLVGSFMYHGRGLHGWRRRCAHTPRVETSDYSRDDPRSWTWTLELDPPCTDRAIKPYDVKRQTDDVVVYYVYSIKR